MDADFDLLNGLDVDNLFSDFPENYEIENVSVTQMLDIPTQTLLKTELGDCVSLTQVLDIPSQTSLKSEQGDEEHVSAVSKILGGKHSDKERRRFVMQHRMHRSSVRPFFCCGSQVSLNSIAEQKDQELSSIEKPVDDDYEDLTDTDETESPSGVAGVKMDKAKQRFLRLQSSKKRKGTAMHDKSNSRKKFWSVKLRGKLQVSKQFDEDRNRSVEGSSECVCTAYRHSVTGAEGSQIVVRESSLGMPVSEMARLQLASASRENREFSVGDLVGNTNRRMARWNMPLPPIVNFNVLYPINDIDEQLIAQRRFEMEHGIELGEHAENVTLQSSEDDAESNVERRHFQYPSYGAMGLFASEAEALVSAPTLPLSTEHSQNLTCSTLSLNSNPWLLNIPRPPGGVHTQVDYKHHLVPDLHKIINSSFYWGVMDRYQAEKLIDNKPEGTFLLRDSAQDEFLFSVSFRRYGRSLHARIEQWNHKFSFDSRDPGVFATNSVCGLIEHYKDPSSCMFFEPMLTDPLHRNYPFSLQHITRAAICANVTYDSINELPLPASLIEYLKFYHYKQKVRVRRFDHVA